MSQHSVKVQDLNEKTELERKKREFVEQEEREYAEAKAIQEAWEAIRTQRVVVFRYGNVEYAINDWLRLNPDWRIAQMSSINQSERGEYGTENFLVVTCLMEKVP